MWLIYESAFPRSERRSLAQHERATRSEPTFHCKQLMLGEKVVGLLFYRELPSCLFVEHLAVAEQCRGLGVGTAALKWLQEQGKLLILEIEPPQDAPSRRRLAFYLISAITMLLSL
ncbi:MAG: GNAT family N-acetyltransferase, partial [Akkermansia sp.]|nr:GNAT family N-acetyltransferase [Akkermansia sp.]